MTHNRLLRRVLCVLLAVVCLVQATPYPVSASSGEDGAVLASQVETQEPGGEQGGPDLSDQNDDSTPPDGRDTMSDEDQDDDEDRDGEDAQDPGDENREEDEKDDGNDQQTPPDETEPGQEPDGQDGEQKPDVDDEESRIALYSTQMLRRLLEELAEALEWGDIQWLDWLLEADCFSGDTRRALYDYLVEHQEEAAAIFAALQELYESEHNHSNTRSDAERPSSQGLEDIQQAGEELRRRMDRENNPAAARALTGETSVTIPVEGDAWLRSLTRAAADLTDEEGESVYRHYQLELGFELQAAGAAEAADIVLLIDNSLSTQYVLDDIKTAAGYFVSRPELTGSESRVAVVSFADDGEICIDLTPAGLDGGPHPDLLEAIRGITPAGSYTNLQGGLLEARRVLGMDDESEADGTQALILFSDGNPSRRVTDVWRYHFDENPSDWRYGIEIDWDGEAMPGAKRWSYFQDDGYHGQVYVDGNRISTGIIPLGGQMATAVTRLEAQFLVSQGVDLYTVDYGGGRHADYLADLTRSLEETPDFQAEMDEPPTAVPVRTVARSGRTLDGGDPDAMDRILEEILLPARAAAPVLILEDLLEDGFELVESGFSWTLTGPDGREREAPPDWGLRVADGSALTWTSPSGLEAGSYTLRYHVRVRDDAEDPLFYFPDGGSAAPSRTASIAHGGNGHSFPGLRVEVPPLLGMEVRGPEAVFAATALTLEGTVTRGNGRYLFAWYEPEGKEPIHSGEVSLEGIDDVAGVELAIPVPVLELDAGEPGALIRILEITDTRAHEAGYRGGQLRETVEVVVVGGELTIRLEGEDGVAYGGRFEAAIHYTGQDGASERYHFMGPGTAVYDHTTGLRPGRYGVSVHVPYGYRVAEPQTQPVEIAPEQDSNGNWMSCNRTVTVRVQRTWPAFFYSWADRLEALGAGLRLGGGERA